ncbi:MAG: pentapeptide repeat-containing protein [Kiritimatiellae bacterium]|nr:pentapeptide repeat-containing protein [Kiritimatiellia bacterium]
METTLKCGKHLAEHADLSGSQFHDVNLGGANFNNVNLSKARFHNINLSDVTITAAQIGGAKFKHIGPPPDKDGRQERQRPATFEEMMLCDSTFRKVDMSNVRIVECNIDGMTIDGIQVAYMMAAYRERRK